MSKVIYSLKVMLALIERGFLPIAQMPNPKNSKYTCWIFTITPEFQSALDEILGGE